MVINNTSYSSTPIYFLFLRDHAVAYYTQAGNLEKMAESHYILEEYEELEKLSNSLPENHPLLEVCYHDNTK